MKIAVTYENGQVFQHFGKADNFKIYEVADGEILSSSLLSPAVSGHSAMAEFLSKNDISVVICGGIGDGAQNALADAGIVVYSGAQGSTDEAVKAFLNGQLESSGVNCNHHEEEHSCCCGSEGGCGGSEGGCGCGCGCHSGIQGKNAGKTCKVHYRGTFNDGTQFDASYDRGEPLEFVCGAGMMIPGFDKAVADMEVGQTVQIHLMPEEAYGFADPNAIITVPIAQLPGSEDLSVGQRVYLYNSMGQPFQALVTEKDAVNITFDANHEMAGKELNFQIELLSAE